MVATLHFTFDVLDEFLSKLQKANLSTQLHNALGASLLSNTQERFKTQKDPSGKKWADKASNAHPNNMRGSILVKSAILKNSIHYQASNKDVSIGTNILYAALHQFGGVITPKNKKALSFNIGGKQIFAKSVTIPARPYLGFGASDEEIVKDTINDFLQRLSHA